jgi:hypothetical protein
VVVTGMSAVFVVRAAMLMMAVMVCMSAGIVGSRRGSMLKFCLHDDLSLAGRLPCSPRQSTICYIGKL